MDWSLDSLRQQAAQIAQQFGIDPNIFVAQIQQESGFNPNAVNGNAQGIAQFMPATAAEYGVTNPYDPIQSLTGAAQYDANLLQQNGGNYMAMLTSYGTLSNQPGQNNGPGSSVYSQFADLIQGETGDTGSGSGLFGPILPGMGTVYPNLAGSTNTSWANVLAIIIGILFIALGVWGMIK